MAFTADLNPKKSNMDLGDLLKMDEVITRRKLYDDALKAKASGKTVTPAADAIVKSDMLKSSMDDVGTPFRFNNSQSE
jgi:hypothetical protein